MKLQTVLIGKISLDPANVRTHDEKNINAIVASLKRFGQQKPIVLDSNNIVRAGNGTLEAAKRLGWKTIKAVKSELQKEELIAYAIADNRTAELADWDDEALTQQLLILDDELRDIAYLDFEMPADNIEPNEKDDEVPDTAGNEFNVELGDVWQLGKHRLMCGDSTDKQSVEKLMDGEKADMVFTDPPYGYSYKSNHQTKHEMLKNDDKILNFIPLMFDVMEDNSCAYVCGSHQNIDAWKKLFSKYLKYKNMIVWMKNNWSMGDLKGAYAGRHELILFGHKGVVELQGKRDSDVWQFDREPPKDHPTQKPVDLISYAISKVLCNRVLDMFLGSGSTLIACEKTNRKCYGMELDPNYCSVIIKRWQDFTGQLAQKIGA
jgi:DNA modification methylase